MMVCIDTTQRQSDVMTSSNLRAGALHKRSAHRCCGLVAMILSALALVACATVDTAQVVRAAELAKGVQSSAVPCCVDIGQALSGASPSLTAEWKEFGPATPHLDFGHGLAPFVAFRVDSSIRIIESESALQLWGWAYGGDGRPRYVNPHVQFYGADGRTLQTRYLFRGPRFTGGGGRSYFAYVVVPPQATHLVVTTIPTTNGKGEWAVIENPPNGPLTSASTRFFSSGGLIPREYLNASYGLIRVRALPNE